MNTQLEEAAELLLRARSRRLLLIEDNAAHAALVRRTIDINLWEIEHVTRASTAIETFSREPDRIVMLDLTLPDSDGLTVLGRLLTINPKAPVVIVTSLENVSTSVEAMKRGAWDYVVKGDLQETGARLTGAIDRAWQKRLQDAQADLVQQAKILELVRAERLEAIELVVRTVCHEVNNPLSGVVALSQLLQQKSGIDEDMKRLSSGILQSAQEVARVVQKLYSIGNEPAEFGGKKILPLEKDPERGA